MAKKRGGIAGFYDRNKGKIRTLASLGAGALGGPLAGAAVGAAFRGLDREGKSGIGFDPFAALPGAVEGYMAGQTGASVKSGLKGLLAPKAPDISGAMGRASSMIGQANQQIAANPAFSGMAGGYGGVGSMPGIGFGLGGMQPPVAGGPVTSTDYIGRAVNQSLAQPSATGGGSSFGLGRSAAGRAFDDLGMSLGDVANAGKNAGGGRIQGLLSGFRKNKDLIEMAGKGVQRLLPNPELDIKQQEMDLEQAKFEEQKRLTQMEEERRRRIAQFLMPYAQQNFPQYFGGR